MRAAQGAASARQQRQRPLTSGRCTVTPVGGEARIARGTPTGRLDSRGIEAGVDKLLDNQGPKVYAVPRSPSVLRHAARTESADDLWTHLVMTRPDSRSERCLELSRLNAVLNLEPAHRPRYDAGSCTAPTGMHRCHDATTGQ